MNRKDFLAKGGLIAAASLLPGLAGAASGNAMGVEEAAAIIPPSLGAGDLIGITSPAGYITQEEIEPAIRLLREWGFRVKIGHTIGKRHHTFGGTDEERLGDLQQMLDTPDIKAILCARGGYGAVRIVDQLRWNRFRQHPKWVIGFSDITVLHAHLNRQVGAASIHSKMCNSFPEDLSLAEPGQAASILSIRDALQGKPMEYNAPANLANRQGVARGVLIGGNLKTIESLAGSASDINTRDAILFVEDTGEYRYSVDRMFWNLERTGKLSGLRGLIVGGFKLKPDDPGSEFGKELTEIVLEKVHGYSYPVCFDFPVGHQKDNFALKCGIVHELRVTDSETSLMELR
jgi:muramoyltetrapeptide carboxypeptidase